MPLPPFPIGDDALFVAYFASAELGCFLALGWSMPLRTLDLFTEFRCLTNGHPVPSGNGLLGALTFFGLGGIDATEKTDMRDLAQRPGDLDGAERRALLDYCESDVVALARLLPAMLDRIDLPRGLLRGRYMAAVATMEWNGVPIDTPTLGSLRTNWEAVKGRLVERIDADFGVFDGQTFRRERFANWLAGRGIPWPRLASGQLALDDGTFRQMARTYPVVAPLRELRHSLGEMRLFSNLAVGPDGRNRCLLSPFRSVTGRNQPSNARFIFGPSAWLRSLIKPRPGQAVAYVDWSGQEYGIAAYLSQDPGMVVDYESGDPYLGFGERVGLVPEHATKKTHPEIRSQIKVALGLGAMYGAGAERVALSIDQPVPFARELLRLHRDAYPVFWRWSQSAVDHAMLQGWLRTVFGWRVQVGPRANPRSLANFPMQGSGAEMLRIACCLATERGIQVCCPVHDALLIEGPVDQIEAVVAETERAMVEASRVVLGGAELRTDANIVRYPDRYVDPRGKRMWETVTGILGELESPKYLETEAKFGD
jgi:hypothetical protein